MSNKENTDTSPSDLPFYKKWWIWTIVILIFLIIGAANRTKTPKDAVVFTSCSESEKIEVIDLSSMTAEDIEHWATENNLKYVVGDSEFSDTVEAGGFISQSIPAGEKVCKDSAISVSYSEGPDLIAKYAGVYRGPSSVVNGKLEGDDNSLGGVYNITLNEDKTCTHEMSPNAASCNWRIENNAIYLDFVGNNLYREESSFTYKMDILPDGNLFWNEENIVYNYPQDIQKMHDEYNFFYRRLAQ